MQAVSASPLLSPDSIRELATSCTRFVNQALKLDLDYTPETLPILDHYLHTCREALSQTEDSPTGDKRAAIINLVVPATGAYFGEVIRRAWPETRWHCPTDDYTSYRLEFMRCFLHFNPMAIAYEAVALSHLEGWNAHFQILDDDRPDVEQALQQAPAVRHDDFFRLAIRFEGVEQVYSVLMARAASNATATPLYTAEIYEAVDGGRLSSLPKA